ncbi:CoA-transferase [Erwinia sp. B116]|uniref:CoA-transferase n=1 Tax=Erwinia sp. B116 TaxID=1561024 RepID=UPI000C78BD5B|nr:CoA-transferase [Erwinia sp. B116]
MKITTARDVVSLIKDKSVVIPGGFGCCGHPDELTDALANRFSEERHPLGLTLFFGSGSGDKKGKGLDVIANEFLVKRAIGGFWGYCPSLAKLGLSGRIEAHNWPLGVISHLFRDIASGLDGHITSVGLHSFVDPRVDGGNLVIEGNTLVSVVNIMGKDMLYFPSVGADFSMLRGTVSDMNGNISMSGEAALHDALLQAMAVRNSGGIIAFQVESVVDILPAQKVDIPGHLVDYVVISKNKHFPSYGSANYTFYDDFDNIRIEKEVIIKYACAEPIEDWSYVNFGIGLPALIGERIAKSNQKFHSSIESGVINGTPKTGMSFGESENFSACIQQSDLFSFYNGGGIDVAFLGFAEIDKYGNVNASSFGGEVTGAGGFINIFHSAKKIYLCGTTRTNFFEKALSSGEVEIVSGGKVKKFVDHVKQITISTNQSHFWQKEIIIITELIVFKLHKGIFYLIKLVGDVELDRVEKEFPFEIN